MVICGLLATSKEVNRVHLEMTIWRGHGSSELGGILHLKLILHSIQSLKTSCILLSWRGQSVITRRQLEWTTHEIIKSLGVIIEIETTH